MDVSENFWIEMNPSKIIEEGLMSKVGKEVMIKKNIKMLKQDF
jgi:hypothetical protein